MSDVSLRITDRNGVLFEVEAPTDMNMSLMEVMRAYEIAQDGEIGVCGGMAMCASCQCYVQNEEAVTLLDHPTYIVGQATVGVGDIFPLFEEDDLSLFGEAS